MKKAMKHTMKKVSAEQYGEICDLLWQFHTGATKANTDPNRLRHTGGVCRHFALQIVEAVGGEIA